MMKPAPLITLNDILIILHLKLIFVLYAFIANKSHRLICCQDKFRNFNKTCERKGSSALSGNNFKLLIFDLSILLSFQNVTLTTMSKLFGLQIP